MSTQKANADEYDESGSTPLCLIANCQRNRLFVQFRLRRFINEYGHIENLNGSSIQTNAVKWLPNDTTRKTQVNISAPMLIAT